MRLFISYSHRDDHLREQLETHLAMLQRQGFIHVWHNRRISPGADWHDETSKEINRADIILLLISSDFLASDYCYGTEVEKALDKHISGEARVIPIILRACDWRTAPFGRLQALPREARPVTSWANLDEAWHDVALGARRVIEEIVAQRRPTPTESTSPQEPLKIQRVYDVFKTSGVPTVTFVETESFNRLRLSIAQPGRGVVVEGPSGIGKTSSIRQAINSLTSSEEGQLGGPPTMLSARNPKEADQILALPTWHRGTVVIDDVHRLSDEAFSVAINQLKYLADVDDQRRKLILVGIPLTGQSLVNTSFDLATRIDIFKLGRVTDDLVIEMITKGELALNILFDRKTDVARAVAGSLNVAQALCFRICVRNNLLQTQTSPAQLRCDIEKAIAEVMEMLALKFDPALKSFARLGEPNDRTCIHIIEHLSRSREGYLSINDPQALPTELRRKVKDLLTPESITRIAEDCPEWHRHFYFDHRSRALVIDDPQLGFYIQQISVPRLMRQAGKMGVPARRVIFISYAHLDEAHLERLRVHLDPLSHRIGVELWDDTRIEPGRRWRDELDEAVDSAVAAILLVSADFLASEFIQQEELPRLLAASTYGTLRIIPVLIEPCVLTGTPLDNLQFANSTSKPIGTLSRSKQDLVWTDITKTIAALLA
ncbi:TIR domain-containing protein [Sorangium sp. So ce1153]|uniref:TIR domain-containing protein n=1 Tax=Sorangium sp. So ce1153 TaxID=3133333 RepID=UPI003F5E9549